MLSAWISVVLMLMHEQIKHFGDAIISSRRVGEHSWLTFDKKLRNQLRGVHIKAEPV